MKRKYKVNGYPPIPAGAIGALPYESTATATFDDSVTDHELAQFVKRLRKAYIDYGFTQVTVTEIVVP